MCECCKKCNKGHIISIDVSVPKRKVVAVVSDKKGKTVDEFTGKTEDGTFLEFLKKHSDTASVLLWGRNTEEEEFLKGIRKEHNLIIKKITFSLFEEGTEEAKVVVAAIIEFSKNFSGGGGVLKKPETRIRMLRYLMQEGTLPFVLPLHKGILF